MVKIDLAMVAVLATLVTPAKVDGVNMAQVDMRTGLHFDERDPSYDRQRRAYEPGAIVGVSPDARPTARRRTVRRLPAGTSGSRR
ncbi:hypothetical protein [Bradyrhizobium neotropicale]|uniref:hypothetical protein n=1 Tax=Bradyrhizobium neotropicale TaxID=1497615 RepID=UPI001AD7377D|nr:hypothetical protein [Bradyrhizobium neotropicale]MBO4225241.1 hypothetical protein [Bradyrhizobium neotropicale]